MIFAKTSHTILMAGLGLMLAASAIVRADDTIARFDGTEERQIRGQQVEIVGLTLVSNGKIAAVPVPNVQPEKKDEKPYPKKDIEEAVKKLTPGQYVKFTVGPDKFMGQALASIDAYDIKPGEDTPHGYVFVHAFDKTVGKNTVTTVVLSKFGVEQNYSIAKTGGEQDPDVYAAVNKIPEQSSVWVQTVGKNIVAIEPYAPPKTGKVTKISEEEDNGHKVKVAEIDTDDGKQVKAMVGGRENGKVFVPDASVMAQLAHVKVGSQVQFRVHEDGDKAILREIEVVKPDKKAATPTPTPAKPPAKKQR